MKQKAPQNRTLCLSQAERRLYEKSLLKIKFPTTLDKIINRTIHQDTFETLDLLPPESINLIFADPPYNMYKSFNKTVFSKLSKIKYENWLSSWIDKLPRILKKDASIYICADWRCSESISKLLEKHFQIANRITWEREKGRGSKKNWKNCSEDIWFATVSNKYTFNADAVKINRQVIAPYINKDGSPKDWQQTKKGRFRTTCHSNIFTDITVPFWSMPENTEHPTQKPEKLLAKIILASSSPGDIVLDPFLGSGTTSVVAKKLNRNYIGIEIDKTYCCLAEKRLQLAEKNKSIQGYNKGRFYLRNTSPP